MGAGSRSFMKPTTVSTAVRACASEMPARAVTCLINSSIIHFSSSLRYALSQQHLTLLCGMSLNEDDRLRVWYLESFAATYVLARKMVVNAYHIVARFLKAPAVLFVSAARRLPFSGSPQPAHIVVCALAAVRAGEACSLGFRSFVEKISFVHINRWPLLLKK